MSKISKIFALILILIMVISSQSLLMIKPTYAQSIPKPSVPQFTVKFVNASNSVTTTNPYTGANETQQIINDSIEVTIKNQPFDHSNYQIYYNIRTKPHFAVNWTAVYPLRNMTSSYNSDGTFSFAWYIDDSAPHANSSYTIINFPVVATEYYGESGYDIQRYYSGDIGQEGEYFAFLNGIPDNAQIDFQVDALVGQNSTYWYVMHPLFPQYGGFNEPAIAYDSDSAWSNTQTITIGEISASPSPTPTVPELSWLVILPLLLSMFSVAVIFRHRKNKQSVIR
jgi:hypothetical protein